MTRAGQADTPDRPSTELAQESGNSHREIGYGYLDVLRGLAALLVVVSHARALAFEPYSFLAPGTGREAYWQAFYFCTALGHQAVVVFFVLSGFLIGRSVLMAMDGGRWSWAGYLASRMSRLWLVLLPSLLLTAVLDYVALSEDSKGFYFGKMFSYLNVGPGPGSANWELVTLAGNALFLQSIYLPVFGSNGPLWSLSYEFWYYMMFPMLVLAIGGSVRVRPVWIVAIFLLGIGLGPQLLSYGLLWLTGVAAYLLARRLGTRAWRPTAIHHVVAILLFASGLVVTHLKLLSDYAGHLALSIATALLVIVLAAIPARVHMVARPFQFVSRFSYSLYLAHFPVIAFLWVFVLNYSKHVPGASALLAFLFLTVVALLVAWFMYLMFESRTDTVKFWLLRIARR